MVHYNFCLAVCTRLWVEAEEYSGKSKGCNNRLGEGVTMKAGRDGGSRRGRKGFTQGKNWLRRRISREEIKC